MQLNFCAYAQAEQLRVKQLSALHFAYIIKALVYSQQWRYLLKVKVEVATFRQP
jgi:hypothetical protein